MSLFTDTITTLSRTFLQDYKLYPEVVTRSLCVNYNPKRILYSAYLLMLELKEIEPIENYSDKRKLWNEVKEQGGDKFSMVALYVLRTLNEFTEINYEPINQ